MITPDALGTLGEQKFGGWCAEENLTFNKAGLDRAGWDFILDFQMTQPEGTTLDHRPGAHTCRIQVKTIGHTKNAVRLRLDMAERLAKDPGPSFVVGIRVDEAHQVVALHVLPMLDDRLAAILKRLRKASLEEAGALSKKSITFPLTPTTKIEASGHAMKSAFLDHVGHDLHSYIQRKQEQLKKLGYEERPFAGTFTVAPDLQSEFEKMFLGHEGSVEVDAMEITHTRFGLKEVTSAAQPAVLSVKAHPVDGCTITVRPQIGPPLTFDGDLYLMPPGFEKKSRIRLKLFDLVMAASEPHQFSLLFDYEDKQASPNEWFKFWSACKAITQTGTLIEVACQTISVYNELRPNGLTAGFDPKALEWACAMSAALDRIAQYAGWPPTVELSWQHVQEFRRWFGFIDQLIAGKLTSRVHTLTSDLQPNSSGPFPIAYVCHVPLGDHVLVCGATAEIRYQSSDGRLKCTLEGIQPKQAAIVAADDGLLSFVERFKRREGLTDQFTFGLNALTPQLAGDANQPAEDSESSA